VESEGEGGEGLIKPAITIKMTRRRKRKNKTNKRRNRRMIRISKHV
jgi:hypothetical protein